MLGYDVVEQRADLVHAAFEHLRMPSIEISLARVARPAA
jgi:hypothetical protein